MHLTSWCFWNQPKRTRKWVALKLSTKGIHLWIFGKTIIEALHPMHLEQELASKLTLQPACSHCRKSWPFAWILCVGNKNLDAAISYHLCQTPLNLPNLSIILNCRYPLSVFTLTFLSSVSNELSLLWKLLLTHEAKLQNCVSVKIVFAFLSLALGKKIDRIYRSPTLLSYLESYSADGLIIWYTCKHMRGICIFKMPSFHKLYSHKSGKSVIMGYLVEAALRVYILAIGGGVSSY